MSRWVSAKTVTTNRRLERTAAWIRLALLRLMRSDGGLRETDVIELTVAPRQLPSAPIVLTAQTVAAVARMVRRSASARSSGASAAKPVSARSIAMSCPNDGPR